MEKNIVYKTGCIPTPEEIIKLYNLCGLPRPTTNKARIEKIFNSSNLVVTAWHNEQLVGVSRSITDWAWSCYLADLAVHPNFMKCGIGKRLVQITKEQVGEQTMMLLLSVPTAMEYYPKIGFIKEDRAFAILRTQ